MHQNVKEVQKLLKSEFRRALGRVGIYHALQAIQEDMIEHPLPKLVTNEQEAIVGTFETLLYLAAKLTIESGNRFGVSPKHLPRK